MLSVNYLKHALYWVCYVVIFSNSEISAFELQKNIVFPQKHASICFNNGQSFSKNIVQVDSNSFTFITERLPTFKEGDKNNSNIELVTLSKDLLIVNKFSTTSNYMMENSYDNPFIGISTLNNNSNCYALFKLNAEIKQIYNISLQNKSIKSIELSNDGIVPYLYGIEIKNSSEFYLYGSVGSNFFIAGYDNKGKGLFTSKYNVRNDIQKIYGICLIQDRIYCAVDITKNNDDLFKLCICKKNGMMDELDFEGNQVSLFSYQDNSILCSYKRYNTLEFILLDENNTIIKTFKIENVKGLLDYKIQIFNGKLYLFTLYQQRVHFYELSENGNFQLVGKMDFDGFFSTIGFAVIDENACFLGLGYPVFIAKTNSVQHEIAVLKFIR